MQVWSQNIMYCSSCGIAVTQNLIYCNRCGAKLSGATKDDSSKASEISPNILVAAMVVTFIFGMAAVIAVLSAVIKGGDPFAIVVLALIFLLILALESIFMWLLLRRKKVGASAPNRLNEQTRKELYTAPPAGMLAEPIPSVTEQTTSLLEPVPREQKSK